MGYKSRRGRKAGTETRERAPAVEIDTTDLRRCVLTLETALERLRAREPGDIEHDLYRAACVKEFELVLEMSGGLPRRRRRDWFASNRRIDSLTFKDVFRHAARNGLVEVEAVERWFAYRDHRNETAHRYGKRFAEGAVELLPDFIVDARALADAIGESRDG